MYTLFTTSKLKLSNLIIEYYFYFYILSFFFLWTIMLDITSCCDSAEPIIVTTPESPDPQCPLDTESSSCSLTEEEKNLQKRDEYIIKIGTGVIICTIIVNIVLYYVLIYSK